MSFPKDAQRKGGQNGKPGKHIKTKQWEQLGDFLTDAGAKRAMDILNDLPDDEYVSHPYYNNKHICNYLLIKSPVLLLSTL